MGADSAAAGGQPKRHQHDRAAAMRNELADIKALLQARIDALVRELAPDGTRAGKYWMAKNPTRDDKRAGSFWIALSGVPGSWRDEATGDKGDVLSLISYITGLDFKHTMEWARDWLGLSRLDDHAIRTARAKVQASSAQDAAREARQLEHKRGQAFAAWLKGTDKLAGTPVDTYLRSRGIDLTKLARPPRALRCLGRKHLESGQFLPCMLALMTGSVPATRAPGAVSAPEGATKDIPFAVHCTFLKPDGSGKADVTPPRKIWPSFKGAAIRLSRGETGLTPGEAAKQGLLDTLVLCEGVEDGLSIALACPEYRVWAAGSLGNLAHITLPACCADVVVAADNDWGKPQAQKQLEAALIALGRQGRPVRVARSPVGKDANDALRAGADWSAKTAGR